MSLSFYDTQSCAVQEISNLYKYQGRPKDAMLDFCNRVLVSQVKYHGFPARSAQIYSFYLFSSGVHGGFTEQDSQAEYGGQFAKFIEDNKLGAVIASPIVQNKAFHPDHANRAWLWAPDRVALQKWFEANKPTVLKEVKGRWDKALGVAGEFCSCGREFIRDSDIWYFEGKYYCQGCGVKKEGE